MSPKTRMAQSREVDYALHTLGWKAFQDLCLSVVSEVLGQTVQSFLPSHDGGRDGAFHGQWKNREGRDMSGSFVVQCKYTNSPNKRFSLSSLGEEIEKAKQLGERKLARNYILISNYKLSGRQEEQIRTCFLQLKGIEQFLLFGKDWLTQKINESKRLRMLVPRIYGLGDLSQILDGRSYDQAQDILSVMGDDLAKFVITDAYRKSAQALLSHGFVLLLGEPASGKSIIAASLSVGAIDMWDCFTLKIVDAEDFKRHWNPNEPRQCFWVDDAFGTTQYQRHRADEWNAIFPHMKAAIKGGSRVIFTSRDYIFQSAKSDLKVSAFPLLEESKVVINVQELSKSEKEQILYNHMRKGTQPSSFRKKIKPYLPEVAASEYFLPESCRRLGNSLFTHGLKLSREGVLDYVERPHQFLAEVISSLDADSRGALTLIFMRGGTLASPVRLSADESLALSRIGTSLSGVTSALSALDNSLVKYLRAEGQFRWTFKHPTIADALASVIVGNPELLDVYLAHAKVERLLEEITCGEVGLQGVKVILPEDYYQMVLERLGGVGFSHRLFAFLANRCDMAFLRFWRNQNVDSLDALIPDDTPSNDKSNAQLVLLARLHGSNLLPAKVRAKLIERVCEWAVDSDPYWSFLSDDVISEILTEQEEKEILDVVKSEFIEKIDRHIDHWRYNINFWPRLSPDDRFQWLLEALSHYEDAFQRYGIDTNGIWLAERAIHEAIEVMNKDWHDETEIDYKDLFREERQSSILLSGRNIFDDVDL